MTWFLAGLSGYLGFVPVAWGSELTECDFAYR